MGNVSNPRGAVGLLDQFGNQIADTIGHSLIFTEIDHYLIHLGRTWVHSDTVSVLAGAALVFLIKNGATGDAHLKDFKFTSTQADADIVFYSAPTLLTNGTIQTWINKRIASQSNAPQTSIYQGASYSAPGTQLEHYQIVGGKQTGGTEDGGGDEWVIPVNSDVLIVYTNNAPSADKVSFTIKMLDVANLSV